MNKLSFKIGLVFLAAIILLQIVLMVFLHSNIIHSRVHDELSALMTRGNNHREILEASFHEETIRHIALMESRTDTMVILTDTYSSILMSSNTVTPAMKTLMGMRPDGVPRQGMILEDDWENRPFIASVTPVKIDGGLKGYIYMFQDTGKLKELIANMNRHFLIAGLFSILFMIGVVAFLSRFLTLPLVRMNEATKRISKGDFSVTLPKLSRDEVGELGQSIEILARDLELLKKERNEFLASISHELRTPLTYIKGYAEIARRPDLTAAERDNYLSIIHEESGKLAQLIKELFNLAKMDENIFTVEKTGVELKPFFKALFEKLAPVFRERQIDLRLDCPAGLSACIDPTRFGQVIVNLLDNARKYSDPGSAVTVEAAPLDGGRVRISIRDTGWGIPEQDLPRIFERFYRVDKSRTRALGGSGLGLAIAKQLVEAHGGTISAKSQQGHGTEFEIIL
ncbi:two-component sensor histidine kinase [Neobacillus piezotolerans]|uniref:histidine kinase n=1 Tax=Neobacillus piezotolerans TaxID=2259171 RepID=A0A3D8GTH5_9BACI|nr:HAMP domain-containing sensor histidine kinase [Neobacillus piezotolerans]RDU37770.1 two-component sensor histidine kinase [Neobacillus piezotolerans]